MKRTIVMETPEILGAIQTASSKLDEVELGNMTNDLANVLCRYTGATHKPPLYFIEAETASVAFEIDTEDPEKGGGIQIPVAQQLQET